MSNTPDPRLRLGFYHHIPITKKGDDLYIIGHMGRFLDGIAAECNQLYLFMHESVDFDITADYCLKSKNISWINMGPRKSAPYFTFFGRNYKKIIEEKSDSIDALLIRGPTPLLPALAKVNKKIPTSLLIGGDYLAGMSSSTQPFLRKSLVWLWSWVYNLRQLTAAKKSLTMVNSHRLFLDMKPYLKDLVETRTTTLSEMDFYRREDTCQGDRIRLLYTGRMDRAKGILDILEAVRILVSMGEDVELNLVGMEEKGDTVLTDLFDLAEKQHLSDRVFFHGYKPVGPELFNFYIQSDIYVLASQSSFEGFPRTIWESLAHCLPVVATRVGSIPDYLTNDINALLVNPSSSEQIAIAINRLIHEGNLRRLIIYNGFGIPQNNTIEKLSKEQVDFINQYRNKLHKL